MAGAGRGRHRVLVVGGGYAGLLAAARIARGGGGAEVALLDPKPRFVQRIRLHEALAGGRPAALAYGPLLARRGIRFVQAWAEGIDPARGAVRVRRAEGGAGEEPYDTLVLAAGSRTAASVPGAAEHALRMDDEEAVRGAARHVRALAAEGGTVLVAGAGLTGIETAAELAARHPGLRVVLATAGELGAGYADAGRAHLRAWLARAGVEPREGTRVAGLEAGGAWTAEGERIPFGLCVWAGGFAAPPLAREAGLPVDADGRLLVDPWLRAEGRPEVVGAGDAAAVRTARGTLRMSCAAAMPMGAHAGESVARRLAGREPEPYSFSFVIRCVSLGRRDGLIQSVHPDDAPRERVWTGRTAALAKEGICRMTTAVLRAELRLGWPVTLRPRGAGALRAISSRANGAPWTERAA